MNEFCESAYCANNSKCYIKWWCLLVLTPEPIYKQIFGANKSIGITKFKRHRDYIFNGLPPRLITSPTFHLFVLNSSSFWPRQPVPKHNSWDLDSSRPSTCPPKNPSLPLLFFNNRPQFPPFTSPFSPEAGCPYYKRTNIFVIKHEV